MSYHMIYVNVVDEHYWNDNVEDIKNTKSDQILVSPDSP